MMLKENSLNDKVVVVTGGGTGLGKSMAHHFAKLGAQLVIASRKEEVLKTTANEIEANSGNKVLAVRCDVRNHVEVDNLLNATINAFGKVDVLVNNAAGNFISPTERLSAKAFEIIIGIVLQGTVNCTLAFGKHWIAKKQQNTNILNMVTTYAYTGSGYVVPSAVAKAGVLALTRSLASEWGKYGIRNNAIAPGAFPTEGAWSRLLPGDMAIKFDLAAQNPLKRVGRHDELCDLASYIISDYAQFINGEVITIDGGQWMHNAGQFNFLKYVPDEMWGEIEKAVRKPKE